MTFYAVLLPFGYVQNVGKTENKSHGNSITGENEMDKLENVKSTYVLCMPLICFCFGCWFCMCVFNVCLVIFQFWDIKWKVDVGTFRLDSPLNSVVFHIIRHFPGPVMFDYENLINHRWFALPLLICMPNTQKPQNDIVCHGHCNFSLPINSYG